MHKVSMEDTAGAFLVAAAGAGNITLMNYMSLLFPTARGEKHHERALNAALESGQLEAAKILMKIGVDLKCRVKVRALVGDFIPGLLDSGQKHAPAGGS